MKYFRLLMGLFSWRNILLFFLVAGLCGSLYWWIQSARYQARHCQYFQDLGGEVWYDFQLNHAGTVLPDGEQHSIPFLTDWLGVDYVHTVQKVRFPKKTKNKTVLFDVTVFPKLRIIENLDRDQEDLQLQLTHLESVRFSTSSRASLFSLRNHRKLKRIELTSVDRCDLGWIENFPLLQHLKCFVTNDSQLDFLVDCPDIRSLDLNLATGESFNLKKLHSLSNLRTVKIESLILPNIDDIENHSAVQSIDLDFNQMGFIPARTYTKVKSIKGSLLESSNLVHLERFPNLEVLTTNQFVHQNNLNFSALTRLRKLKVGRNSWLPKTWAPFENLEHLTISEHQNVDLRTLRNPERLKSLVIEDSDTVFLPNLEPNSQLTQLELTVCRRVTGMPTLLPLLESISINQSNIDRCPGGPKLKKVINFASTCNDYSGLQHAVQLTHFHPSITEVQNIDFLGNAKQLKHLSVHSKQITQIDCLQGIKTLDFVDLADTKVQDLGPIKGSSQLQQLSVANTPFSNLKQLKWFQEMKQLSLKGLEGIDLAEIKNLPNLQKVYLQDSRVINFQELLEIESLQRIHITEDTLTDEDFAHLEKKPQILVFLLYDPAPINQNYKFAVNTILKFLGRPVTMSSEEEEIRFSPIKIKRLKNRLQRDFPGLNIRFLMRH